MSPRERSAWICLASNLIVFVPYFMYVLHVFANGAPVAQPLLIAFVVACICNGVINGGAHILMSVRHGLPRGDERDDAIEAKALRIAYFSLISLLLTALATIAALGAVSVPSPEGRIWVPTFSVTSQFMFFCIIASEAMRHLTEVICYRREAWA